LVERFVVTALNFSFLFAVMEFELRALHLLYQLSHTSSPDLFYKPKKKEKN
jgi:hypothetical protein